MDASNLTNSPKLIEGHNQSSYQRDPPESTPMNEADLVEDGFFDHLIKGSKEQAEQSPDFKADINDFNILRADDEVIHDISCCSPPREIVAS